MSIDVTPNPATHEHKASRTAETTVASSRILLIQDEPVLRLSLKRSLEGASYAVVEAMTGEEAIQAARVGSFDLGILDLELPGTQGITLLRSIMEETCLSFVVLSEHSDDSWIGQAIVAGALGYLVKPFEAKQLMPCIRVAIKIAAHLRQRDVKEAQLNLALAQARDISVAMGVVMSRMKLSRDAAFDHIRNLARRNRRKLVEMASKIVLEVENGPENT